MGEQAGYDAHEKLIFWVKCLLSPARGKKLYVLLDWP